MSIATPSLAHVSTVGRASPPGRPADVSAATCAPATPSSPRPHLLPGSSIFLFRSSRYSSLLFLKKICIFIRVDLQRFSSFCCTAKRRSHSCSLSCAVGARCPSPPLLHSHRPFLLHPTPHPEFIVLALTSKHIQSLATSRQLHCYHPGPSPCHLGLSLPPRWSPGPAPTPPTQPQHSSQRDPLKLQVKSGQFFFPRLGWLSCHSESKPKSLQWPPRSYVSRPPTSPPPLRHTPLFPLLFAVPGKHQAHASLRVFALAVPVPWKSHPRPQMATRQIRLPLSVFAQIHPLKVSTSGPVFKLQHPSPMYPPDSCPAALFPL